ncbi:MAG: hypothetical protein ACYC27_15020 [Armatimonadota bacterium]
MRSILAVTSVLVITTLVPAFGAGSESSQKKQPVSRKDAIFGIHFDLHASNGDRELGANITEENIAKLLKKTRPDFVQNDCKGHAGYTSYPTKVGTASPGIIKDALAIWRKVTDEYGVKLFIHYSGVYDAVAVEKHPDWARIDENGNPDNMATSTFGPYVDELLIPQLREVSTAYRLDGMWVDGECWGAKIDYSPAAVAQWKLETGYTDVPKGRNDAHWAEWKNFQRRQFEKYLCHWVDELHKTHPNLEITSNWAYTSMMPKPVVANLDYISGDYSPMQSMDSARFEARYVSNLGKPWDLMAWGFNWVDGMGHTYKMPVQLKQEAAVVLMNGGAFQVYYNPTRPGYVSDDIIDTTAEVADFCRERKSVCKNSTSVPQVAMLYSAETVMDKSDTPYSFMSYDTEFGALQALLESHFSVDVLAEFMLQPRLSEFPLVVIPDSHKLTDSFRQALLKYVDNGGKLLLLGEKCARIFQPALGVEFDGDPAQSSVELLTSAGIVNENGVWQKIKPVTAETLAYRYPFRDPNRGGEVAATTVKYGKGQIAAVYGPVLMNFHKTHHPKLRTFIGDLARKLFPNPAVEVDGPPCIDVSLRHTKDGKLSLHLLNTANMQISGSHIAVDYISPVGPIDIRMRVEKKPSKVTWVPDGGRVKWDWKDGVLSIKLKQLPLYGILVVD